MPLEQSFAYNRFIQDDNYELDSSLVINHATINFLKRLRSFNSGKTKDSKVKLYGMDYNSILSSTQSSAMDIFDLLFGWGGQAMQLTFQYGFILKEEDFLELTDE